VTLDQLQADLDNIDQQLIAAEHGLPDWPSIPVDEAGTIELSFGRKIQTTQPFECANVRLFDPKGTFLGLGEMSPDGVIQPKRMFVLSND
jgi:tRNA pseudouridine55 synthase